MLCRVRDVSGEAGEQELGLRSGLAILRTQRHRIVRRDRRLVVHAGLHTSIDDRILEQRLVRIPRGGQWHRLSHGGGQGTQPAPFDVVVAGGVIRNARPARRAVGELGAEPESGAGARLGSVEMVAVVQIGERQIRAVDARPQLGGYPGGLTTRRRHHGDGDEDAGEVEQDDQADRQPAPTLRQDGQDRRRHADQHQDVKEKRVRVPRRIERQPGDHEGHDAEHPHAGRADPAFDSAASVWQVGGNGRPHRDHAQHDQRHSNDRQRPFQGGPHQPRRRHQPHPGQQYREGRKERAVRPIHRRQLFSVHAATPTAGCFLASPGSQSHQAVPARPAVRSKGPLLHQTIPGRPRQGGQDKENLPDQDRARPASPVFCSHCRFSVSPAGASLTIERCRFDSRLLCFSPRFSELCHKGLTTQVVTMQMFAAMAMKKSPARAELARCLLLSGALPVSRPARIKQLPDNGVSVGRPTACFTEGIPARQDILRSKEEERYDEWLSIAADAVGEF